MDKILTLLDGSAYSESVCHHTAWIAGRLGAEVEALHVLGRREGAAPSDLSGTLRLGARSALLQELATLDESRARLAQARGHAILEDAKAILERDGVAGVTTRLRRGDLLEAVRALEPEIRAITLGKRGEGADFASGHLGSNLERIVRSTRVPVFVAARDFRPITSVLLAYDGSASARVAVDRMAASPVFKGLAVTVVCVAEADAGVREDVDQVVQRLSGAGMTAEGRVLPGSPEEVLAQVMTDAGADLLVMGAYGHSRIRALIIGSTTTALIQTVRAPVLLYR
ncbi:universal stress protein [Salipiger marinus]|uniref:universal stress protein n=1 Tax=Salipiger marinus TaxID=555512 RepID=UPI001E373A38|nr:universal stress protein [Salipiger manganoxidans]MCD1618818.1 universal stress protein [Salipiger manganoxidans]MEB3419729.1 universal stress protein [Salipiger manganoxidans]